MKVAIIDCRDERRLVLERVARLVTADVTPLDFLGKADLSPDVLLLHVGADQEADDDIEQVLSRFQGGTWVLCYYGGAPVPAAENCASPNVAVFHASVGSISPSEDFVRTVQKVLARWPERATLAEEWFRETVTGFDPVLEAKLDVLEAILKGEQPAADRLKRLMGSYRKAFGESGEVIVDHERPLRSVARIRNIFFHEEPWEDDS
jgi:hypothetical protein